MEDILVEQRYIRDYCYGLVEGEHVKGAQGLEHLDVEGDDKGSNEIQWCHFLGDFVSINQFDSEIQRYAADMVLEVRDSRSQTHERWDFYCKRCDFYCKRYDFYCKISRFSHLCKCRRW